MKKFVLLVLATVFSATMAFSQDGLDRFVAKYKRKSDEKVDLTLPGWVVRLGANFCDEEDLEGVNLRQLSRKISELRVVSLENCAKIEPADYTRLISDMHQDKFEDLLTVRSADGDNVHILIREKKEFIRELLILVREEGGDFVAVDIYGKFTMDDINSVIKDVKMQ